MGDTAYFSANTGDSTEVIWDFGDGGSGYSSDMTHVYNSGLFHVKLTRINGTDTCFTSEDIHIDTLSSCHLTFSSVRDYGSHYTFSVDNPDASGTYLWNCGDGYIGYGNAVLRHTFTASGIYNISLTYYPSSIYSDSCNASKVISIDPQNICNADVDFESSVSGTTVDFSTSSVNDTLAHWYFGDGTEASGAAVSHTYSAPGTYPVTLTDLLNGCMKGDTLVLKANQNNLTGLINLVLGPDFPIQNVDQLVAEMDIVLYDQSGNIVSETHPDSLGNYSFSNVSPGDYNLSVNVPGFGTVATQQFSVDSAGLSSASIPQINLTSDNLTGTITAVSSSVRVSPNPATDMVKLETGSLKGSAVLMNVNGVVEKTIEVSGTTKFLISDLPPGSYFIRFVSDETVVIKQFVKQ
jgi:hypothetical protein